jgi:hypothetical protein
MRPTIDAGIEVVAAYSTGSNVYTDFRRNAFLGKIDLSRASPLRLNLCLPVEQLPTASHGQFRRVPHTQRCNDHDTA